MQSKYIELDFGKLHYLESMADKEQTLLLLHAFHSSAASYAPVCDLLKGQFNLICLDIPGHGLSAHVDCEKYAWQYSMEGFTQVLIEFIERLNLQNYVIAGDSVGGNMAVRAMSSLSGLKGLVLMGSAQAEDVEKVFALHHQSEAINVLFQSEHTPEQVELLAAAYVDPQQNDGQNFELMKYDLQNTDPNCREQFALSMGSQGWVDELALIQNAPVPLMYVLGAEDGFINSPYYKDFLIKAGFQESQIHLLKNVRHVPQLDAPEQCAVLISGFTSTLI